MVQMEFAHQLKTVENINTKIRVIEEAIGTIRFINDDIAKYILATLNGRGWSESGIFKELEETFAKVVGEDKARYWFVRLKQESQDGKRLARLREAGKLE
jgi:hypothetical protein